MPSNVKRTCEANQWPTDLLKFAVDSALAFQDALSDQSGKEPTIDRATLEQITLNTWLEACVPAGNA